MKLDALMINYLNYASRFIPPRQREAMYLDGFWTSRALDHIGKILTVEREINQGIDLSARLSGKVHSNAYAPKSEHRKGRPCRWQAKDFALNAYGIHHVHVGERRSRNEIKKSNELLFLHFSRKLAIFLMLGDHDSFDDGSLTERVAMFHALSGRDIKGVLGLARPLDFHEQNQIARKGFSTALQIGQTVTLGAMITTSGHSTFVVRLADEIMDALEELEPKLSDRSELIKIFGPASERLSSAPEFVWTFDYSDLILYDQISMTACRVFEAGC